MNQRTETRKRPSGIWELEEREWKESLCIKIKLISGQEMKKGCGSALRNGEESLEG